jgi:hypothetical protein
MLQSPTSAATRFVKRIALQKFAIPVDDKVARFKVGDRCRMRAGGARCTVVRRKGEGYEARLEGGGGAFCTAEMLVAA